MREGANQRWGKVTFNEVTRCLSSIAPGVPYNASVTGYNVFGYGKTITAYGYIQELGMCPFCISGKKYYGGGEGEGEGGGGFALERDLMCAYVEISFGFKLH